MKNPIIKNIPIKNILSFAFIFIFCSMLQAQDTNIRTDKKISVKLEIGHGALHCPFLGPKLESKIKQLKAIESLIVNKEKSFMTFYLPVDTEITKEMIKKIGVEVGYPEADVSVTFQSVKIESDQIR